MPVSVEAAQGAGFPRVRGFWSAELAARSGLRVGDELRALDGESLAGMGQLGLLARMLERAARRSSPSCGRAQTMYARRGSSCRACASLGGRASSRWRSSSLGALAFWRARGFRPARLLFGSLFGYGVHWAYFWGGTPAQTWAGLAAFAPRHGLRDRRSGSRRRSPSRSRRRAGAAVRSSRPGRSPSSGWAESRGRFGFPLAPETGYVISTRSARVVGGLALLAILTRNYRRAGPTGRRQIKWVLVGLYLGLAPPAPRRVRDAVRAAPRLALRGEPALGALRSRSRSSSRSRATTSTTSIG